MFKGVLKLDMFSKSEIDYLNKIPKDKIVKIFAYNPRSLKTAQEIIDSIVAIYPNLEIKHMGASLLKISGQNDLDIYAFSEPKDFKKFLPGITKVIGVPLHVHNSFIEWGLKKNGFDVQFYLTQKDSPTMQRQIKVFEVLINNPGLLKEYESLKESMNGKSFRRYQEKKYEFYHKILGK